MDFQQTVDSVLTVCLTPRAHPKIRRLVHHFVRLVSGLKPKYFVFENVRGLTVGEHKRFLREIISEFQSKGYLVEEDYLVLNAMNFWCSPGSRTTVPDGLPKGPNASVLPGSHP